MYGKRSFFGRNRKTLIVFLVLIFTIHFLSAQDNSSVTAGIEKLDSMQSWLLYVEGIHSFGNRDFGKALNCFNKLVERHGVYPEAEYWIGRVFEEEGEDILAEKQYLKALEAERVLKIPEEKYTIRYRLAELYKNRGNTDQYKQILTGIVLDELQSNQLALANEGPAVNTLKREGIDRMLLLFRHKFTYSVDAFNQLGIYDYKTADYRSATSRLIYPVLSFFSISIDYIRSRDPGFVYPDNLDILLKDHTDYVFDTLEKVIRIKNKDFTFRRDLQTLKIIDADVQFSEAKSYLPHDPSYYLSGASYCLDLFAKDPVLKQLMDNYEIFRTLYYLACSLYAEGYSESAERIWEAVANSDNDDRWANMSLNQLANPVVETGQTIF